MNTRPVIDPTTPTPLLSVTLNTPRTRFTSTTNTGFNVYETLTGSLLVSRNLTGGLAHATLLNTTNYLALVGGGRNPLYAQTKVQIWDDIKSKPVITLDHKTAVLRVRLTKTHIAVALQNSVHLYTFASPPVRTAVFETSDNHHGLLALGSRHIAFPGRSPGKLQLVELEGAHNVSIIPAHTTSLRALDLSPDGTLVATASEQGTLIRVFSTANCAKVAELRRGVDQASVFSIATSPDSNTLAVTSDKGTMHLFDLSSIPGRPATSEARERSRSPSTTTPTVQDDPPSNKWGLLSRLPLLPRVFSDTYSFASCPIEMPPSGAGEGAGGKEGVSVSRLPALGSLIARPPLGQIGWIDERTLVVLSAGLEGRWEKFVVGEREMDDGTRKRVVWRDGWRRLGAN